MTKGFISPLHPSKANSSNASPSISKRALAWSHFRKEAAGCPPSSPSERLESGFIRVLEDS